MLEEDHNRKPKFDGLLLGTILLPILTFIAIKLLNKPRCPVDVTQDQINSSGCVVGVNIGLTMLLFFVLLPTFVIIVISWVMRFKDKPRKKE